MARRPLGLWLLTRKAKLIGYDEAAGFIVAARSAAAARHLVVSAADDSGTPPVPGRRDLPEAYWPGTEGPCPWADPAATRCTLIGYGKQEAPGVILRDYRAG